MIVCNYVKYANYTEQMHLLQSENEKLKNALLKG